MVIRTTLAAVSQSSLCTELSAECYTCSISFNLHKTLCVKFREVKQCYKVTQKMAIILSEHLTLLMY